MSRQSKGGDSAPATDSEPSTANMNTDVGVAVAETEPTPTQRPRWDGLPQIENEAVPEDLRTDKDEKPKLPFDEPGEEDEGDTGLTQDKSGEDDEDEQPADEKPAEKPKPEAEEDKTPALDESLLAAAEQLGVDRAIAEKMTPEALTATVTAFDRRFAEIGKRQLEQQPTPAGNQPPQVPATPSERQQPQVPLAPTTDFKLELGEDVDPDVAKAVTELHKHHSGQFQTFQSQVVQALSKVVGRINEIQARAEQEVFDTQVGGLDADLFGKGPTALLSTQSDAFQNRVKLNAEARALALGYKSLGLEPPPNGELLTRAFRSAFGDQLTTKTQAAVHKQVNDQLRDQKGRFVPRPTHRTTAEPALSPRERAIKSLQQRRRERGEDIDDFS